MTAQEAMDFGLIDKIIYQQEISTQIPKLR